MSVNPPVCLQSQIINLELVLADLDAVTKRIEKVANKARILKDKESVEKAKITSTETPSGAKEWTENSQSSKLNDIKELLQNAENTKITKLSTMIENGQYTEFQQEL